MRPPPTNDEMFGLMNKLSTEWKKYNAEGPAPGHVNLDAISRMVFDWFLSLPQDRGGQERGGQDLYVQYGYRLTIGFLIGLVVGFLIAQLF